VLNEFANPNYRIVESFFVKQSRIKLVSSQKEWLATGTHYSDAAVHRWHQTTIIKSAGENS